MILYLSTKCRKALAWFMFMVLYLSTVSSALAIDGTTGKAVFTNGYPSNSNKPFAKVNNASVSKVSKPTEKKLETKTAISSSNNQLENFGGPSQPEMASFKSVGTDNMVNLFTGNFSYNIPLMDVGGYPINIFYDGGITPEQEASWVGLGWNINPGTINRNMRGVPDDFDGTDIMVQKQAIKPNKTWGISTGLDIEVIGIKGIKLTSGNNFGISYNNYLGPALDFSHSNGASISMSQNEKSSLKLGVKLGINLNSRYGMTTSLNASLTGSMKKKNDEYSMGIGLGTSYNSRTGIRSLQLYDQVSFNTAETEGSMDAHNRDAPFVTKVGASNFSSSISFAKPSYVPAIRMPVTNKSGAGRFQFGGALFGIEGDFQLEVSAQESMIALEDRVQRKPLVGYLYAEKANSNANAVMDFTRLGDKEVTPNTTIISAPQYTYDVFSISGEGTGGSIRAYRNDFGTVRDNYTETKDKSGSAGADIAIPGHYGSNFNTIKTPSSIGEWNAGNKIKYVVPFRGRGEKVGVWENAYFRNPGETSVLNAQQFNKVGGTDLVRFELGGTGTSPIIEPKLEKISQDGYGTILSTVDLLSAQDPIERKKRTQVTSFLTAGEASEIGLDHDIKSYGYTGTEQMLIPWSNSIMDGLTRTLNYTSMPRVDGISRKKHHISQINVTEADGKRYVYGLPVYNTIQKDFTFSVATEGDGDNRVGFSNNDMTVDNSPFIAPDAYVDGYVQIMETPAYAHAFLLSGLLSPDYVDITGNGITEDDLGNAVKFNYTKMDSLFKWRSPHAAANIANFNPGHRTVNKDNKALVTYGERESWYMHSIESKTMIAIFSLGNRDDGKGTEGELGGFSSDNSLKRLDKIDLFSKADLKANGIAAAKPIKTVYFEYEYVLCKNTPDNRTNGGGKLTLTKIYFTFNGQARNNKSQYVFNYGDINSSQDNPSYSINASDRWGNYKPASLNPDLLKNTEYPYAAQATNVAKTIIDKNAAAWCLKKILLPSGGQIEVDYESDDYAFVQNRRATAMMSIAGFTSRLDKNPSNKLYELLGPLASENEYVVINVSEACGKKEDVKSKYLLGVDLEAQTQLAFRLAVNMPKGVEYMTAYAEIKDYGVFENDHNKIWIELKDVDGVSPLSLVAIEYLRERLPGQAYHGYDVSDQSIGLKQWGEMLLGMLDGIASAFKNPLNYLRSQGLARSVELSQCFVRLDVPNGYKMGGGNRVKAIKLKDNWDRMTQQYASVYGQTYDYTTKEVLNGAERTISSGVASYEPGVGSEENPFQTIVQVANSLPLGPTSYGSIEMPILDALFPAPLVGYSKVTVRSLKPAIVLASQQPNQQPPNPLQTRSGIGKQVTEFYTAKDFPVKYNHTPLSQKDVHTTPLPFPFYKESRDRKALSQGFLVELNDMHGKMKKQSSYSEKDEVTAVNSTENFYRNTGEKGLNEQFDFVSQGGAIAKGNMGVDIELMTDTREFKTRSYSTEVQAQVDMFPITFVTLWLPFIWPVYSESENTYRAVTTTKVVNYHSIVDRVVVKDKGSEVSTENIVFDAETGQVVVNRTNNEFNKPIYSTNYPAYWAYSGMGLAYKNIDAQFSNVNFSDGVIVSGISNPGEVFESGDEIYIINGAEPQDACDIERSSMAGSSSVKLIWAFDKAKDFSSSLTNTSPQFIFIDGKGNPYTRKNVTLRIVRSGKRNMLGSPVAAVTSMANPVVNNLLDPTTAGKVVNASATEYKEKWQTDDGVIKHKAMVYNSFNCETVEVDNCTGYLEKNINPYVKGLIGTIRNWRGKVFYGDREEVVNATQSTKLPEDGLIKNFNLYWNFNSSNNLVPTTASSQWVFTSQLTHVNAKGMELETEDALHNYTAAQYGYKKTVPVAIGNNTRYNEMGYEGFEDVNYEDALNGDPFGLSCPKRHFDLSAMSNASVVSTTGLGFNAHTGKKVLRIEANPLGPVKMDFPLTASNHDNIDPFVFPVDASKSLINTGYNVEYFILNNMASTDFSSAYGTMGMAVIPLSYTVLTEAGQNYLTSEFSSKINGYFETDGGVFDIEAYASVSYNIGIGGGSVTRFSELKVEIFSLNGAFITDATVASTGSANTTYATVCLPKGIYKAICTIKGNFKKPCSIVQGPIGEGSSSDCDPQNLNSGFAFSNHVFSFRLKKDNQLLGTYKDLSTASGCSYSKAIAGNETFLNPVFAPTSNKKMIFSAWVKEDCGNPSGTPCTTIKYNNSKVELSFWDNATTPSQVGTAIPLLSPTGPIIEGWQKVEGEFMVPLGASTMKLALQNNANSAANYWDDIRIHPFNSNMKSYVYDPINLRLVAELDANNYASFYEYDAEGTLIRTKAETREGIKTIKETRSAKQKAINNLLP